MASGNVRDVNERSIAYHQSQGTNQVDPIIVKVHLTPKFFSAK